MELEVVDPLEVKKHPKIIKEAQSELGKLDVLVCGRCHNVFYYIEQFQEHRTNDNCTGVSAIRDNNINESKAQVWAFLLWKSAQHIEETENSWLVYQRWCKMDAHAKEAWIVAGRNVQVFTKLSAAKMQEVRSKMQMKQKIVEEDPLEEGEIRRPNLKQFKNKSFDSELEDPLGDTDEPIDTESELDTEEELEREEMEKMKSTKNNTETKESESNDKSNMPTIIKKMPLNSSVTITPAGKKTQGVVVPLDKSARMAKRTDKATSTVKDSILEKILAKRFNPRKKLHEYLLKWDGCPHDQNTWEPAAHMESCKHVLEAFERNLARQKEAKALANEKQQQKNKPGPSGIVTTPGGRPQRTSKQKAMDQVKAWCGNISDRDDDGPKRKGDSDSDDEVGEKKIKLETETDSEDDALIVKPKILQKGGNAVNGVAKKPMTANEIAKSIGLASPERPNSPPVVLSNTKNVVKVYQRQMSNLSSGVYIMSKKEGIVKLDSSTQPNANIVRVQKAGQPIVRVAPKVGQTHVRLVQKNEANSAVRLSPGMSQASKPKKIIRWMQKPQKKGPQRVSTPIVKMSRGGSRTVMQKVIPFDDAAEEQDKDTDASDDDYDPFPKDLPPLEPDSPPREFTLDPETGVILGQAEGEPEPQLQEDIKEEPTEEPDVKLENLAAETETAESTLQEVTTTDATATISIPEGTEPLMITGEDGVVYQVAGQNEEGQTLLVAQSADGQQQCVYVTTTEQSTEEGTVLTLDTAVAEAMAEGEQLTVQTNMDEEPTEADTNSQVVAQLVKAELPSPGGTRKVVLLLPDGNLLMTEVDAEQFEALELDK